MNSPIEQFRKNMERVRALGGLYHAFGQLTTPAVDLTDLLRAQIVLAVSAMDLYIHEITRIGMLEGYDGKRPQTNAFSRFQIAMDAVVEGIARPGRNEWLEAEIREKHGYQAFQHPDKIADAVRLFSSCELWPSVAAKLNLTVPEVKAQLLAIVNRRNQIAHEADLMPNDPTTRWSISDADVEEAVDFIEGVCEAIDVVV